jgi:hypothetical protein
MTPTKAPAPADQISGRTELYEVFTKSQRRRPTQQHESVQRGAGMDREADLGSHGLAVVQKPTNATTPPPVATASANSRETTPIT